MALPSGCGVATLVRRSDQVGRAIARIARTGACGSGEEPARRTAPGARRCEDILFASGIPATVVRASWFMQNFTEGIASTR